MKNPFAPLRRTSSAPDLRRPQEALITGTFQGNRVWVKLSRRDGCQIARAKKLGFLVPGMATARRRSAAATDRDSPGSPARIASRPSEDRPLRRRRAPPAPRDPPRQGARPPRRRRRPQPRRRQASQVADVGEAVDFTDVAAVTEVGRRHGVDGVLTVSADRAVPGRRRRRRGARLPGIGTETAHLMTHKIAMRRTLADAGVPQPRFAARATSRARAPRWTPSASRRC